MTLEKITPYRRFDAGLIELLQNVYIVYGKRSLADDAGKLLMTYSEMYQYVTGRKTVPATMLMQLIDRTGDLSLAEPILRGTDLTLSFVKEKHAHSNDLRNEVEDTVVRAAELLDEVRKALNDNKLDPGEKIAIKQLIRRLRQDTSDVEEIMQ